MALGGRPVEIDRGFGLGRRGEGEKTGGREVTSILLQQNCSSGSKSAAKTVPKNPPVLQPALLPELAQYSTRCSLSLLAPRHEV